MKRKMKKHIILSLLILSAVVWGFFKYRTTVSIASADAILVEASEVKESNFPLEVHAIGTLVARSVEITPAVSGHVEKVLFEDGTAVKQGATLIQLDDAVYKAKYSSAKARYVYSDGYYQRMQLLGKKGVVAQQAIEQAEADLKEKRADAEEQQVLLNKLKLSAPFDGMVGKSRVNVGDYVTVGQSVVTLTDTQHLRIEYNIPEKFLALVKLGQEVNITSTAYPGKTFVGKVAFISPTINTTNRSLSLYAEIPNQENLLAAGMFVNVMQSLGKKEHTLFIPSRSLMPTLEGEQVFKVVDGKAVATDVEIGQRTEKTVQILQGLSVGDVIVTDGQFKLKNGMSVKVKS